MQQLLRAYTAASAALSDLDKATVSNDEHVSEKRWKEARDRLAVAYANLVRAIEELEN